MEDFQIKLVPNKILRKKCEYVTEEEFGEELDNKMSRMLRTMMANNGVGLAGPQVNDPRRILVADAKDVGIDSLKMVNPEVVSYSDESIETEEGCLSVPGFFIKVSRPKEVVVKYSTPFGEERQDTFSDFAAVVVQHEMDHLDGITLLGKASRLKRNMYLKKISKYRKKLNRAMKKISSIRY